MLGSLYLGYHSGGSGDYDLLGGSLTAVNEYVGYSGSGYFHQNGGTNTVTGASLYVGYNLGSTGTYDLHDPGVLSAVNEYVGYWGTGTFNQDGGTNTVSDTLRLGFHQTGSGAYNLSGGHAAGLQ